MRWNLRKSNRNTRLFIHMLHAHIHRICSALPTPLAIKCIYGRNWTVRLGRMDHRTAWSTASNGRDERHRALDIWSNRFGAGRWKPIVFAGVVFHVRDIQALPRHSVSFLSTTIHPNRTNLKWDQTTYKKLQHNNIIIIFNQYSTFIIPYKYYNYIHK